MKYFKTHPFARLAAILSPLLLCCIILMNIYTPKEAQEGFKSFTVAFEFAKTKADTDLLFDKLSAETFKLIDTSIYIDYLFIITYSILLIMFFRKSARISNFKWLMAAIPILFVVFFGDFFENIHLLKITAIYRLQINENVEPLLNRLHVITWIKWGGLAVAFLMISVYFFRGNWLNKLASVICFMPFLSGLFALNNSPSTVTLFTNSIFAAFGVVIIYSFFFRKPSV